MFDHRVSQQRLLWAGAILSAPAETPDAASTPRLPATPDRAPPATATATIDAGPAPRGPDGGDPP